MAIDGNGQNLNKFNVGNYNNYNIYNQTNQKKAIKEQPSFEGVKLNTIKTDGFIKTGETNKEETQTTEESQKAQKKDRKIDWFAAIVGLGALIALTTLTVGSGGAFWIAGGAIAILGGREKFFS